MADYDLITDILQRLTAKGVPVPASVAHAIDTEARRDWGGKKHYISLRGEVLMRRDKAIRAALNAGDPIAKVAHDWQISERRVRQIVSR